MAIDPYRVLGLSAGASPAEVKQAYRRLAKANHPDSAGEAALPRFLEIQRAYEALASGGRRPGARRSPAGAAPEPWRADPSRARTTPGAEPPGATGRRTGGRRGGPAGGSGRGSDPGGSSPGGGPRPRSRSGPGAGPSAGSARPGSGASGAGGVGSGSSGSSGGRRRASKTATFGSTTYDEARDQADTSWAGASWYGPSSGEYWRVNPREYADPRKHGPEYQARAAARAAAAAERRAPRAAAGSGSGESPPGDGVPFDQDRTPGPEDATPAAPGRRRSRPAGTAAADATGRDPAARVGPSPRPTSRASHDGQPGNRPEPPSGAADVAWPGPRTTLSPLARRSLRALIAWPPLGIAAAAVIGEATGCASFEATCTAPADLYPWLAQAAILLALLALPSVARAFAGGTAAVAVLAFPVAAALSASGAGYDRTYGPAALIGVLAVVWVLGVGAVLLRRTVTRSLP